MKSRGDADGACSGNHTLRNTAVDDGSACNSCVCACLSSEVLGGLTTPPFIATLRYSTTYCDGERPTLRWRPCAILLLSAPPSPTPPRVTAGRAREPGWRRELGGSGAGKASAAPGTPAETAGWGDGERSGARAPGRARPLAARRPLPAARPALPESRRWPGLEVSGGARRRTFPAPAHIW